MTWLAALGRLLGAILAEVLPVLLEQWRKPRGVEVHGGDKEAQLEIEQQIERDSLRDIGGTRIGPDGPDSVRRTGKN